MAPLVARSLLARRGHGRWDGLKVRFCDLCGQPLGTSPPPAHAACVAAERASAGLVPGQPGVVAGTVTAPAPVPIQTAPTTAPPPAADPPRVRESWTGRPMSYPGVRTWLAAGIFRNWRGVSVGLLCAWFQVPLVIMVAPIGAILGGVAGALSGTAYADGLLTRIDLLTTYVFPLPDDLTLQDLLPTWAWQIGFGLGMLWGALNGAITLSWIAVYWPWEKLYEADPSWPVMLFIGQVLTGLTVGLIYTVWSIATERNRLKMAGARWPSRREEEWLWPLVEEIGGRLGLRGLPILMVTDSREANAYAESRHIVVHRGLLEHLAYDRDAVAGVIAHELGHWHHGDPVSRTFVKGVSLPLYLLHELAVKMTETTARLRPLQWIVRLLLWGITTTVRVIVRPVQASMYRREEYTADTMAVAAGYGPGLYQALTSFQESFDGGRDGWDQVMMRTHPSTELRMEALEEPGKDYPLVPGAGGGSGSGSPAAASTSTSDKGW